MLTIISFKPTWSLGLGNETDRLALLALKDHLIGGSPGALNSWNDSFHFCEWQGVKCDWRHQRVSTLNLTGLELGGIISPLIGNFTFLKVANFSHNKLRGNIPIEIGHLRQLRYLNLSHNNLQGHLPLEFTNCSNLQTLILSNNNLTGKIPFNLGSFKNLFTLSLADNNFIGSIPSSFGNLSSLNFLGLEYNYLEGIIPSTLGRLSNLEKLRLGANKLFGTIPPAFYNLSSITALSLPMNQLSDRLHPELGFAFPKLESFNLAANKFTGMIPQSTSDITRLQMIDIGGNNFFGSVPNNLGNLKNIELLSIQYNNLGSGKAGDLDFPSSLINCSQSHTLLMRVNRFGGVLPDSIANLSTQIQQLEMGGNQISGSIPEGIGNLVGLNSLDMGENFLTGNIPNSLGKLQNLEGMDLHSNSLFGKIPSSMGNLTRLSRLYLYMNNFEGPIPLSLKKCESLELLKLGQNKLSGAIPDQLFSSLKSLVVLNLSPNSFTGFLPSNIGSLKNLAELYVDNNNFFGQIPRELGEVFTLTMVNMEGNSFEGSIPQSFGYLKSLENLDLSNNKLSGSIPLELAKLPFLVSLNISFNQFKGEVPTEGVFKNVGGFSFLKNKKLCEGLPELRLPKCFDEKKSTKVIIATILSILLGSILAVLLVYLLCARKSGRGRNRVDLFKDGYLRLSYNELLEATQGFASSNLIGSGSFGYVYKGLLCPQEKPIAVKVLNLEKLGATRSFMAECKALRKVRHRNLLKIITSCSSIDYQGNDFKALVFELMPNGSLEGWLHNQHESRYLNLGQRLDIAIDVANAIDYLHHDCETLIVHCDLKSTNVLLDDGMVAHVGDFGLAKLLSIETDNIGSDQTSSSMIKGTIGYVAPEYGMGGSVSPKGDIYSYGILILEMVTGRRPTDDLFCDGLSLHNFCKMTLLERLEDILDLRLLEEISEHRQRLRIQPEKEREIWECLVSITKIGVACSVQVPGDIMRIKDAIAELKATKARLLRTRIYATNRS